MFGRSISEHRFVQQASIEKAVFLNNFEWKVELEVVQFVPGNTTNNIDRFCSTEFCFQTWLLT